MKYFLSILIYIYYMNIKFNIYKKKKKKNFKKIKKNKKKKK